MHLLFSSKGDTAVVIDGEISAELSVCVLLAGALFSGDLTAVLVHILVLLCESRIMWRASRYLLTLRIY